MTSPLPADPAQDTQVVIVDDHTLFAQALELALSRAGYATTSVGVSQDEAAGSPLLREVLEIHPDVMLLDLDLGAAGDGFPLIEPSTKAGIDVVVLTASEEPGQWARAVMTGARKVLSKASPLTDVVSIVRQLVAGQEVMEKDERQRLLDAWVARRAGHEDVWDRFDELTPREAEVLGLLMQGQSVRDIAQHGNVSESTVRTQVKSVLAKLKVSSQLAAVGLAYQIDWVPPVMARVPGPDLGDA
jgi:two-component system, NarL family, nitrate/nitrite response regulator NarL